MFFQLHAFEPNLVEAWPENLRALSGCVPEQPRRQSLPFVALLSRCDDDHKRHALSLSTSSLLCFYLPHSYILFRSVHSR
jgi:hypothetical protein